MLLRTGISLSLSLCIIRLYCGRSKSLLDRLSKKTHVLSIPKLFYCDKLMCFVLIF